MHLFKIISLIVIIANFNILLATNNTPNDEAQEIAREISKRNQREQAIDIQTRTNENVQDFKGGALIDTKKIDIDEIINSENLSIENSCYTFTQVKVVGNTVVSNRQINKITNKYLNKCLSVEIAQEYLLEELTLLYQRKGYILAIPYLPEQNLGKGILEIIIKEGILERIDFDNTVIKASSVSWAFPFKIGKPVNIRDLEQSLETLNYSGDYSVTMNLAPGDETGQSVLVLKANRIKPNYYISLGITNDYNTTSPVTFPKKELRNTLTIGSGNTLIPNDTWSMFGNYTLKENQNDQGGSAGFTYNLPLGYWNITLNNNTDGYVSQVIGFNETNVSSGISVSNSIEVKRVVSRGASYILKSYIKPNTYGTFNYLNDKFIKTSSYKLYYLDLGLEYQYFSNKVTLYSNFTYSHAHPMFGQQKQGRQQEDEQNSSSWVPQNLYNLYKLNFNTTVPIVTRLTYVNRLSMQYTKDLLPSLQDFNVASSLSVRAYEGLSNSLRSYGTGFSDQNEVTLDIFRFNNKYLSKLSISGAIDVGAAVDDINFAIYEMNGLPIMGWYSEIKLQGKVSMSIGYGRPIGSLGYKEVSSTQTSDITFKKIKHEVVKFSLSVNI
jgi:hemolysin activation/secretion protein